MCLSYLSFLVFSEIVLAILFQHIRVIPISEYEESLKSQETNLIKDQKDIPYIACALATNCTGIWSNDKDFEIESDKITIFKTQDIMDFLKQY